MKIKVANPEIGKEEIKASTSVLESGWIGKGEKVEKFEKKFANYSGARFGIATNSGTAALYLCLKFLGIGSGDEVIIPSLTWTATAASIIHCEASPVFADISLENWCLEKKDVVNKIGKKAKAIIPVHYAGRLANCDYPNHKIIEDSAHRIKREDFKGNLRCHSFYVTKNITTIKGGMILTNDKAAARWFRKAVKEGIEDGAADRYYKGKWHYEVEFPSWDFNMSDVEAAIGLEQLKKIKRFNRKREKIVKIYNQAFKLNNTGNHLYPILVENRDKFIVKMQERGIQTAVHYYPLHQMKAYKKWGRKLKNTEFVGKRCVSLPLWPSLKKSEIEYIIAKTKALAIFTRG